MFRRSNNSNQLSLFSNSRSLLTGKSLTIYEDNHLWHNQFREQVLHRIDEELFRPLFREDFGAPNASIRILIGMMILKEAQGWSDLQLFEQCRFNLLVRSALGLYNIDDAVPAESTYYLLRHRIVKWEESGNDNLIEKVFSGLTKSQAIDFKINGNKIRMDSKLLGSNIAWYSRYELIHETVRKTYVCFKAQIDVLLSESEIKMLERISEESGDKVSYRSNKSDIESKLADLGLIIYKIISQMNNDASDVMQVLRRVFSEQYQVVDDMAIARAKHEISACSVQSPHDTDCHFRKKDENKVKGYSINVTETCDAVGQLNLVTNVIVETASASDCDFLQPAVEATREVVIEQIETVNADGAYHSEDNQDYCQQHNIDLVIGAIQGKPSRYDLKQNESGELTVTDLTTNTEVTVRKVASHKKGTESKWAIRTENDKYRYFTQKEIDTCSLRKQIAARPQAELNRRNNVEATIFQLGYHYPNDKSRYRGLIKHKMWANTRCMWVNFVRIMNYIAGGGSKSVQPIPNCVQNVKNWLLLLLFLLKYVKFSWVMMPVLNCASCVPENRLGGGLVKSGFL
jgi:hypothetical protein